MAQRNPWINARAVCQGFYTEIYGRFHGIIGRLNGKIGPCRGKAGHDRGNFGFTCNTKASATFFGRNRGNLGLERGNTELISGISG